MRATTLSATLAGLVMFAGPADAQSPPADGRVTRVAATACAALGDAQLPDVRIKQATPVATAERITVPHCKVEGTIGREIGFEVLLPDDWNQRFVMGGGGGFVGRIDNQAAGFTVNRGYATAGTDTGHRAAQNAQAGWALHDLERQVNYGHLAVHRTSEVAKALVRLYYGAPARYSYFAGCSNGGRQGLMEAQRYPDDFDGIVAGAPALDFTHIVAAFIKNIRAIYPDPQALSSPVISADNLTLLAAKVLEACDARDGVADQVLNDPRECKFEVASLPACAADRPGPHCVTETQRRAIADVYAPTVIAGKTIYAGQPFGGEAERSGWGAWITGPRDDLLTSAKTPAPVLQWAFATEFYKYFVLGDPSWDYTRYDLSTWERDTKLVATMLNATNPDLSAFAKRGGKLLLWHGWSDAALNAHSTVDYYEQVRARDSKSQDTVKLFMLPGVQHCAGGAGPDTVDWLQALAEWVERGQAPQQLLATKRGADGKPARTRPVCPYPQRAVYSGTGSTDEAGSFVCRAP